MPQNYFNLILREILARNLSKLGVRYLLFAQSCDPMGHFGISPPCVC